MCGGAASSGAAGVWSSCNVVGGGGGCASGGRPGWPLPTLAHTPQCLVYKHWLSAGAVRGTAHVHPLAPRDTPAIWVPWPGVVDVPQGVVACAALSKAAAAQLRAAQCCWCVMSEGLPAWCRWRAQHSRAPCPPCQARGLQGWRRAAPGVWGAGCRQPGDNPCMCALPEGAPVADMTAWCYVVILAAAGCTCGVCGPCR